MMTSSLLKGCLFGFFLAGTLFFSGVSFADDITFKAAVDKEEVALGDRIQLSLIFNGVGKVSAPKIQITDAFRVEYVGPATRISVINTETSSSVTHRYLLVSLKEGKHQIGPFSAIIDGRTYTADPVTIDVLKETPVFFPPSPQAPQSSNVAADTAPEEKTATLQKSALFLTFSTPKNTAYLNEMVPLSIKLYSRHNMPVKINEYPRMEAQGFTVLPLGSHKQYQENVNGAMYDVVEFPATGFATRTGVLSLGPAHLDCALLVSGKNRNPASGFDSFFDQDFFNNFFGLQQTQPMTLNSSVLTLTILPLPEQDRPEDFSGAVGNFMLSMASAPVRVNVGDPVTLTMRISGNGNFNTVACPLLSDPKGFKIYDPQVREEPGAKAFEQIIMPQREDITMTPQAHFSFFDPEKQEYRRLTAGPLTLEVAKAHDQGANVIVSGKAAKSIDETAGQDIAYIKRSLGPVDGFRQRHAGRLSLWFITFAPVLALIILFMRKQRSSRMQSDPRYARALRAPLKARYGTRKAQAFLRVQKTREFYDCVFKTIREYFGDKFHAPGASLTLDTLDQLMIVKKVPQEIRQEVARIFKDCDAARYAPLSTDPEGMKETFDRWECLMDFFEKNRY